jgi:hypothetical protein
VRVRFRRTSACVRRAKGRVDRRVRRRRARDMRRLAQRRKVSAMPHLCARAWAHAPGTRAGHTRTAQHAHSHYAASSPATAALHARLPLPVLLPEHTRLIAVGSQGNPRWVLEVPLPAAPAALAATPCFHQSGPSRECLQVTRYTLTHERCTSMHSLARKHARTHAHAHARARTRTRTQ